jgi:archaellum component FlaC
MASDTPMASEERVQRLEAKVDQGFADVNGRMDRLDGRMERLEDRMDAFNTKLDVGIESLRSDMKMVVEHLDAHIEWMKRTIDSIRHEHSADRRLMYAMLRDHNERLRLLERDPSVSG